MPNGSAEKWEEGWRHSVDERLSSFDGKLDQIVAAVQGLVTRMSLNEETVREMRESKKTAPRITQGWLEIMLMAIGLSLTGLCSASGLVIGLINLLRH